MTLLQIVEMLLSIFFYFFLVGCSLFDTITNYCVIQEGICEKKHFFLRIFFVGMCTHIHEGECYLGKIIDVYVCFAIIFKHEMDNAQHVTTYLFPKSECARNMLKIYCEMLQHCIYNNG